tara:strand:+ start:7891 stop:9087 length:1197 start_codon:yes stop_codon:yes gene_type:complete
VTTIQELTTPMRRETDLQKIAGRLEDLANSRFDIVADQSALSIDEDLSQVNISTGEATITETGVSDSEFNAEFTRTAWRQIAERLRIPVPYLDRLATDEDNRELASTSINWLATNDSRRALYRFLRDESGDLVLRSILSDRFQAFDNDLAIQALIEGLGTHDLGLGDCEVSGDVTPDRLRLRIHVPQIELLVPDLLGDYKMPFSMRDSNGIHDRPDAGETPPVLFAGVEIGNSETGHGTFFVSPRAVVGVCRNGLTRPIEFKRAHIGGTLAEGQIDWSSETRQNLYSLVASQVGDVMKQYLSVGYLETLADEMRAAKGVDIDSPAAAIEIVTDKFGLSETESRNVFDCFARGGDATVLGIGNAVTAAAQLVDDGDRQSEMESNFWNIVQAPEMFASAT